MYGSALVTDVRYGRLRIIYERCALWLRINYECYRTVRLMAAALETLRLRLLPHC